MREHRHRSWTVRSYGVHRLSAMQTVVCMLLYASPHAPRLRNFNTSRNRSMLWIVILAVIVVLGLFLFSIMALAKQEDRMSRHIQYSINPFDDITITRPGD